MDAQSLTTESESEIESIPLDRLFRVPAAIYRGMVEHGLFRAEEVALADGLLVGGAGHDPSERLYRMPLDVYERVGGLDLLGEKDRKVELLDGLLVRKMTKNDPHIIATYLIQAALAALVPRGWCVFKEDPVALPAGPRGHPSMPEPDAAVIRGEIRSYRARRVSPADMALVVEVAHSSLRVDRVKLARYARAGIPVAWLVNLNNNTVEVHANPTGPTDPAQYRDVMVLSASDEVPVVIDGLEVGRLAVADLLP